MRKLFFLCNLILFSMLTMAQVVISGKIKDNKGRPVPGASIAVKDSYDGATSDSSGHFHFKTTEKGAHLLTVSSIGFRAFEQGYYHWGCAHIAGCAAQGRAE